MVNSWGGWHWGEHPRISTTFFQPTPAGSGILPSEETPPEKTPEPRCKSLVDEHHCPLGLPEGFLGGGFNYFFNVHPFLGIQSILTNIFLLGWNHQLVFFVCFFFSWEMRWGNCWILFEAIWFFGEKRWWSTSQSLRMFFFFFFGWEWMDLGWESDDMAMIIMS